MEQVFLEILEDHKNEILSKDGTREGKLRRQKCWEDIARSFLVSTGKQLDAKTLKIKWNNIQGRVKDKTKSAKGTGGGPSVTLSSNDKLAIKILGEDNPKLCKVPGGMENTTRINSTIFENSGSSDDPDPMSNTIPASSLNTPRRTTFQMKENTNPVIESSPLEPQPKRQKRNIYEDLQIEVMELEREKLKLEIQVLRKKLVDTATKSTQTVSQPACSSFLEMLEFDYV